MAAFPYVCMHNRGVDPCGGPAFLMRREPETGEVSRLSDAAHLDGSPIPQYSVVSCDSCGRPYGPPTVGDIVPLSVLAM